ncbi:hypothetical protein RBJ15_05015 [Pantoea sp. BS_4]|uniref:hypothetical protein n=1 Tax=Pantoea TaxID=53335 RepID=UPI00105E6215|nr:MULTISPECIES: hypothetical protein [Pantoea]MBC0853503.1 hypothetical protein [Pantoea stewartii]MCU7365296.1 hypothetical protein [Pantoea stewartii]MDF7784995.1 hypothetical protein [Pantoea stewartii]MDK2634748.1 hypothetical protein [Pantoea stewartii subsp. indologenes]MEB6534119.1 hypothetical protein [Pantoea stewartii]
MIDKLTPGIISFRFEHPVQLHAQRLRTYVCIIFKQRQQGFADNNVYLFFFTPEHINLLVAGSKSPLRRTSGIALKHHFCMFFECSPGHPKL